MAALLSGIASRTLRDRVRRLIDSDVVRRTLDEHTAILDAIAAGDPALARAAATMHVANTEAALRRMFAERARTTVAS
jgi:GntR family transcriptional repressor for pyruvate dehydrogenase complex